jgi:hypothetical protein
MASVIIYPVATGTVMPTPFAYWYLGDYGSNYPDQEFGGYHLTKTGTTTDSRGWTICSSGGRLSSSNSTLKGIFGNNSYSVTTQVIFSNKSNYQIIGDLGGAAYLFYNQGADRLDFQVGLSGGDLNQRANSFGSPYTDEPILIVAWVDKAAETINIQVNGGTVDSTSYSGQTLNAIANDFALLNFISGTDLPLSGGRARNFAAYNNALSSDDRTKIYNRFMGRLD